MGYKTKIVIEAIEDINYKRKLQELSWMSPEDKLVDNYS
jgi:hypothetical protein